jgi:hypothetical protein
MLMGNMADLIRAPFATAIGNLAVATFAIGPAMLKERSVTSAPA